MCTCSHFPEGKIGANSDPMGQLDTVTHKNGIIRSNSVAGSNCKRELYFFEEKCVEFSRLVTDAVERNEIYFRNSNSGQ